MKYNKISEDRQLLAMYGILKQNPKASKKHTVSFVHSGGAALGAYKRKVAYK